MCADKGQDTVNPLGFDIKLEGLQLAGTPLRVMFQRLKSAHTVHGGDGASYILCLLETPSEQRLTPQRETKRKNEKGYE